MRVLYILLLLSLTACAGAGQVIRNEKYVSPMAGFSCGPFELETRVDAAFGPHGGTVRFIDDVGMNRVDVEEFSPKLSADTLSANRDMLYRGYLNEQILPLVKRGVPNAELLAVRSSLVREKPVFVSAILMPGATNSVTGDGKRMDGIRGQLQYTNGDYIYTVSTISNAFPDRTREDQIALAIANVVRVFERCTFP